ncbi:hypothetical protein V5O48_004971 [Marasmius crinis-equi]|uniref:Uncharacterized protein n=1 Tax=Marasmius crinis-equi TaxID=585013 RepID=A0ABR3FP05_9AGAR
MVVLPHTFVFISVFEIHGNLTALSLLARLNSRVPPRPGGNINLVSGESHYLSSLRVEAGPQETDHTLELVTSAPTDQTSKV